MGHNFNRRNIIIVVVCFLAVVICAGTAVVLSGSRNYDEAPVSGQEELQTSVAAEEPEASDSQEHISQENHLKIEISASEQIPEELDAVRFVKQGYELKNMLAAKPFASVSELTVNQVVQYAFCYLYVDDGCLLDYKPKDTAYRQATVEQIRECIVLLFGSCPFDITESQLYSSGNNCFEMWQPDYSGEIYAAAEVQRAGDDTYRIKAEYFEDEQKTVWCDTAAITVKKGEGGGFYIVSLA